MIDFNMAEIVVLGVLAVIIFGPEKLPDLARKTARVLSYLRNIANDAQGRLRQELGPEFADLELADLNPRALVAKHLLNPIQEEVDAYKPGTSAAASSQTAAQAEALPATASTVPGQTDPKVPELVGAPAVVAFDTEAT
ncbi:MAG: sec-independent translocase [Propionicimonas sp.]